MESSHQIIEIWHTSVLPPSALKALDFLSKQEWLKKSRWYLAGGTALSLQCGHRQSVDLDFFTPHSAFSEQVLLSRFPPGVWQADIVREGTIYGKLFGAKASFIAYPFFIPQQPYQWYGMTRVLSPRDIVVMKIIAVSQRGRKRDFVDMYWYVHHKESLLDILRLLPEQYPTVAHDYHHILKSLVYFEDAENDPMPKLFFKADWKTIKRYFQREVPDIAKRLLKLT